MELVEGSKRRAPWGRWLITLALVVASTIAVTAGDWQSGMWLLLLALVAKP